MSAPQAGATHNIKIKYTTMIFISYPFHIFLFLHIGFL